MKPALSEAEGRAALVEEAKRWAGRTPYTNVGAIAGAGANCAMLMYGIYRDAKVLPSDFEEPHWYSPQLHVHSPEERLIFNIEKCGGREVLESEVKPGDVVAFLTGRSHGHLAMVVEWPRKIIQSTQRGGCQYSHGKGGRTAGCRVKFYSLWPPHPPAPETEKNDGNV